MTTADRIKERRESLGLSQTELANRIGLKNKTSITKIEQAGDKVTLKHVEKIAKALSCSVTHLLGYEDINGFPTMDYSIKIPYENGEKIETLINVCKNLKASDIETLSDMAQVLANKGK